MFLQRSTDTTFRLSILMQGRSLKDAIVHLKRLRIGIFALLCVLVPLFSICSFLNAFEIGRPITGYITTGVIIVFCFVLEFSCGYHMIKLLCWAIKESRRSNTMKKILRKTVWLALANFSLLLYLAMSLYSFITPTYKRDLWTNSFGMPLVHSSTLADLSFVSLFNLRQFLYDLAPIGACHVFGKLFDSLWLWTSLHHGTPR